MFLTKGAALLENQDCMLLATGAARLKGPLGQYLVLEGHSG